MQPVSPNELKLDRSAFSVGTLDDEDPDRDYWFEASVEDRLRHLELLRRLNYGRRATGRMVKVLAIGEL
jgi:hypothetical protein